MSDNNHANFVEWLTSAAPGDSIVYFNGNLTVARGDYETDMSTVVRTPALDAADAAWFAASTGFVNLVQRAILPLRTNGTHPAFEYIAQRTSKSFRADPPAA